MGHMERTLYIAAVALLISGCGESHRQKAEKVAQQLKKSPTVAMQLHFHGQKVEAQLSPQAIDELITLIADASPDRSPADYEASGEITFQSANGGKSRLLVLQISESEAGLRLDGGTYLRKIDANKLKKLLEDSKQ
jgi:hypothetical protein